MLTENAIQQNNVQTSIENKEVEPVEPVQMNIYQSNTYRKDLSRLHFDDEPRVQCPTFLFLVEQIGAPAQIWQQYHVRYNTVMYCRFLEIQNKLRRKKPQNDSRLQFSWWQFQQQIMQETQCSLEEKVNPNILKQIFPQEQTRLFSH